MVHVSGHRHNREDTNEFKGLFEIRDGFFFPLLWPVSSHSPHIVTSDPDPHSWKPKSFISLIVEVRVGDRAAKTSECDSEWCPAPAGEVVPSVPSFRGTTAPFSERHFSLSQRPLYCWTAEAETTGTFPVRTEGNPISGSSFSRKAHCSH